MKPVPNTLAEAPAPSSGHYEGMFGWGQNLFADENFSWATLPRREQGRTIDGRRFLASGAALVAALDTASGEAPG